MQKLAFVFPGQGSQALGMLGEFSDQAIVRNTFTEASEALGYDLWTLISEGPAEKLNQTNFTQPALLSASVAVWRLWQEKSQAQPTVLAGHSLGEYSALVCAGVLSLNDAVKLVEKRGELMQEAVPKGVGAMAAIIGLADDKIIAACEKGAAGQVVSAVNFNSPGQVVIAGNKDAVERAGALCKDEGAKRVLPLPVSVPSHCALMKPAADKLALVFETIEFNTPTVDVINNVNVKVESSATEIKEALIKQLYSPVRWTETVAKMADDGIEFAVEAGPGKVLQGLNKRIDKRVNTIAVNDSASLTKALETIK